MKNVISEYIQYLFPPQFRGILDSRLALASAGCIKIHEYEWTVWNVAARSSLVQPGPPGQLQPSPWLLQVSARTLNCCRCRPRPADSLQSQCSLQMDITRSLTETGCHLMTTIDTPIWAQLLLFLTIRKMKTSDTRLLQLQNSGVASYIQNWLKI